MEFHPSNIQFAAYQLIPSIALNAKALSRTRRGYWLRSQGRFADYLAWPEFGDSTWEQDHSVPASQQSGLWKRCLQILSTPEVKLNEKKMNQPYSAWFENHFLVTPDQQTYQNLSVAYEKGFRTFKLKIAGSKKPLFSEEQKKFFQDHPNVILRLDANHSLEVMDLPFVLDSIKPFRSCVEFLEDPFPSAQDPWAWKMWNDQIPLAADFEKRDWMTDQHVRYFIVKPQREDPDLWIGRQKSIVSVITHSMESPLGVALTLDRMSILTAKWGSAIHPISGLMGFHCYQDFDERLFEQQGSKIRRSTFSYDEFLGDVVWQNLV